MTRFWRPLTPADWTGDERGSVMPMFVIALVAILSLVGAAIPLGLDSRATSNPSSYFTSTLATNCEWSHFLSAASYHKHHIA